MEGTSVNGTTICPNCVINIPSGLNLICLLWNASFAYCGSASNQNGFSFCKYLIIVPNTGLFRWECLIPSNVIRFISNSCVRILSFLNGINLWLFNHCSVLGC